jgi:hypothetical protein
MYSLFLRWLEPPPWHWLPALGLSRHLALCSGWLVDHGVLLLPLLDTVFIAYTKLGINIGTDLFGTRTRKNRMKYIFAFAALVGTAGMALGISCGGSPTPGPLLGVVGGPWGVAVAGLGYGVYRLYKART